MAIRTNEDRLVRCAVQGGVAPSLQYADFEISRRGVGLALPSVGGITYNVRVGDSCMGLAGDHIEPGVSAILDVKERSGKANLGFNFLACVGNLARVVTGDAKGAKGTVIGTHGGVEHVVVDFPPEALAKMTLDDKILIEGYGQGLRLLDHPEVRAYSLDPRVLARMGVREKGGALEVPVAAVVPAQLMGSGIGSTNICTGDYDIMTSDAASFEKYGLAGLRFGDFVAVLDHDNSYGRDYVQGAVSVGVVVHSDSILAGHGPGLTTVLTARDGRLRPVKSSGANLAKLLGIGAFARKKRSRR